MHRFGLTKRHHRTLGVAIAIFGWMALSPAEAHASCGDYVVIGESRMHGDHAMPAASHAETPPPAHRDVPCPCQGPSCSGHQPMPAPIPPPVPSPTSQDQIVLAAIAPRSASGSYRFAFESDPSYTFSALSRIDHPPR